MHIAIAGNIGSGKTTLATELARHLGYEVHYEDPNTNQYLADFYNDMQRWAFNLQVSFLEARLFQTVSIQRAGIHVVQDRTLYEDAEIFAPNLLAMGLMQQRDFDTYKRLYDLVNTLIQPPDLVIYLRASIARLVDHIASRGREYEDSIRIDYLKRLNERYDEWFNSYSMGRKLAVNMDDMRPEPDANDIGRVYEQVQRELFGLF